MNLDKEPTELKLTSDLFDKVAAGRKTSTIRRPGKVKTGDLFSFVEVIGDSDTINRSGELIPEVAREVQPRTLGPMVATGVYRIEFLWLDMISIDGGLLGADGLKALCYMEGLKQDELLKFIRTTYGFGAPLELIRFAPKER